MVNLVRSLRSIGLVSGHNTKVRSDAAPEGRTYTGVIALSGTVLVPQKLARTVTALVVEIRSG